MIPKAPAFLPSIPVSLPRTLTPRSSRTLPVQPPPHAPVRRPRAVRAVDAKCLWVERSASVKIELSAEEAYDYYIDLEAMPEWSPWLKSVVVDRQDGDVSRWTLAARGIEIAWKARNTEVRRGEIIAWKSESGLPNRGKVLFRGLSDSSEKSEITLAIQFDVPAPIARAIDNDFIGRYVESTLREDLERFRKIALTKRRRARIKGTASKREAGGGA